MASARRRGGVQLTIRQTISATAAIAIATINSARVSLSAAASPASAVISHPFSGQAGSHTEIVPTGAMVGESVRLTTYTAVTAIAAPATRTRSTTPSSLPVGNARMTASVMT